MLYVFKSYSLFENTVPGILLCPGRTRVIDLKTLSECETWSSLHKLVLTIKLVENSSHTIYVKSDISMIGFEK